MSVPENGSHGLEIGAITASSSDELDKLLSTISYLPDDDGLAVINRIQIILAERKFYKENQEAIDAYQAQTPEEKWTSALF